MKTLTLGNRFSSFSSGNTGSNSSKILARVVDVILDSTHPEYEKFGGVDAINGIKYRILGSKTSEKDSTLLNFARPEDSQFKTTPLIDEIVEIVGLPSKQIGNSTRDDSNDLKDIYYRRPINIFNNATHNALPDEKETGTVPRLGEEVEDNPNIRLLQPFPGDTIIEGRNGQTIRLSGNKSPESPFTDDSNNGQPYIIIRNGQKEESDISRAVVEDINEDDSSIYITSDHTIPLIPANEKYDTYSQGDTPEPADLYKGRQIIIDSGRVFVNAKDDSILFSGKKSIGASGKTVNIDGQDYIQVDAKKIYLGANASDESEPVVLGNTNEEFLNDLIDVIDGIGAAFRKITAPAPPLIQSTLLSEGIALQVQIQALKASLPLIKSKKVFTE